MVHRPPSSSSGQRPRASNGSTTWPGGHARAPGTAARPAPRASVARSSGPMCTKCDVEQHAQQSPHGTSASASCRSATRIRASHAQKSPAGRSPAGAVRLLSGSPVTSRPCRRRAPPSSPECRGACGARRARETASPTLLRHRPRHSSPSCARRSPSMSSFFILSIACIVRSAFSRVGVAQVLAELPRHHLPRDAEPVGEPAALLGLGRTAVAQRAPSSGRPPPASRSR